MNPVNQMNLVDAKKNILPAKRNPIYIYGYNSSSDNNWQLRFARKDLTLVTLTYIYIEISISPSLSNPFQYNPWKPWRPVQSQGAARFCPPHLDGIRRGQHRAILSWCDVPSEGLGFEIRGEVDGDKPWAPHEYLNYIHMQSKNWW